jgi:SAM-dependent methyltransferase
VDSRPSPLDSGALIPPSELLYDGTSSQDEFVLIGERFCSDILIPRGRLAPTMSILDVGCGNGAVARALTHYLRPPGRYDGLDVNAGSVAWLKEHYQPYPDFRFTHADVRNKVYNPGGRQDAVKFALPFTDANFDVVLLKSVFTHMLPHDVRTYLGEISRVLKPAGRAVLTFFLLNDQSRAALQRGGAPLSMGFTYKGDEACRIHKPDVPEWAVSHDERRIRGYCADAGLAVVELAFGNWSGQPSQLGLQDLVVALKE